MDLRERKKQSKNRTKRQKDDDTSPKTYKRVEKPHSLTKWLLIVGIIFIKFAFAAKLFPYLKFSEPLNTEYLKLADSPKFNGHLAENTLLQHAQYFAKGNLIGPETIAFLNDSMYAGLANGQLVRIDKNGNTFKIVQIGDEIDEKRCSDPATYNGHACGRPLGLRVKEPNLIYIADPYCGIIKVDVTTNTKTTVLGSNDKRLKNGKMKFADDLDLDDEGNIYFSDASGSRGLGEAIEIFFEAKSNAMVYRYNERTDELELLMDDLRFSNGVQLTPQKDALIVAELTMARLIKYYVKGPKKGQTEVFANLPGYPDNIRLSEHETYLVAIAVVRFPSRFYSSIMDLLGEYPWIRRVFASFVDLHKLVLEGPKYGLVIELDLNGNIVRSWHDPTGKKIGSMTCITQFNGKLYLGLLVDDYLAIIDY